MDPSGRKSIDGKSFHYPILYPNECVVSRTSPARQCPDRLPFRVQLLEPPQPVRRDQCDDDDAAHPYPAPRHRSVCRHCIALLGIIGTRLTCLSPLAHWKFQLYASAGASLEKQAIAAGGSGGEMDELKRTLIEVRPIHCCVLLLLGAELTIGPLQTNPWLLGTTVLVSILHMLFEFLAFSSVRLCSDPFHSRRKSC
jgi:hypothetical protein